MTPNTLRQALELEHLRKLEISRRGKPRNNRRNRSRNTSKGN